jgi:hypothetical protein
MMEALAEKAPRRYVRTGLYIRTAKAITKRDRRTEYLVKRMYAVLPHLGPADRPTCKAWAQLEIMADVCFTELRENGVFNAQMEARRLLDDFRKLRQAQLPYATALGLTPASRLQINASSTSAALDLVGLLAEKPETADIGNQSDESAPDSKLPD